MRVRWKCFAAWMGWRLQDAMALYLTLDAERAATGGMLCYCTALQKAAYSTHLQGEVLDGASLHATSCQNSNAYRYCLTTVCFEIRFHVLFLRVLYCTVCGAQPGWSSSRSSALHANPGTACALLIATRVGAAVAHRGLTVRSPRATSSARTGGRLQLDRCSYRRTVLVSHRDTSWLPARVT
jgi:hypothetical protein